MLVPKDIFLFFLCNWEGNCYYLDENENIQLGNLASGIDFSLADAPIGWLEQELQWSRNEKYFGFIRAYSPELKFVRQSAKLIRKLFYTYGIEQNIYFVATKWNSTTGNYELYYKAELNFAQISEDNPLEGIKIKTIEGGLLKLIKAYENTVFEIPCDGSIPENLNIQINGLMFQSIIDYDIQPFAFIARATVLPIVLTTIQGNDVGIIKTSQSYLEFDTSDPSTVLSTEKSSSYCFGTTKAIRTTNPQGGLIIEGGLTFSGSMTGGRLFILFSDGSAQIDIIPSRSIGAETITFSKEITVPEGARIFICFECMSSSSAAVANGSFRLSFNSQFENTNTYAIKPYDLLSLIFNKIYSKVSTDHNISYPIVSSLLEQYANLVITSGSALRQNSEAVIKISLADFFEIYNPILCAAMGNEPTDTDEQFFFETREIVYNNSQIDLELGEVAKLKITPASDLFFDKIKIGYKEQKYDNKQGNDEFNTTAEYKTPIKKISKELNLVSKARADAFGIEYTRFLVGTTQTSNNKSDNDLFLLNIDLSTHNNIEVTITGDISEIPVPGALYQDHGSILFDQILSLLKYPLAYSSINGSVFANNFSLEQKIFTFPQSLSYPNTLIRYNNPASGITSIYGKIYIAGSVNGLICPYKIIDRLWKANIATNGTIYVLFKLKKNDITILGKTIPMLLTGNFQVQFDFQTDLQFMDTFYIDWEIAGLTYRNGTYYLNETTEVLQYGLIGQLTDFNITFSTSNAQSIYGLKRINYDTILTSFTNPLWAYNIEDLTPARMIINYKKWIKSLFYNMSSEKLYFQTTDKNHNLSTTINGKTISEGIDIFLSDLGTDIIFYPYYFEFDTEVPQTFIELMNSSRNAHIHFTYYGIDFYGFPVDIKVKPALNDTQHWKLLASASNDISNFIDFDLSGIKLLNLKQMSTFISHLNPVKFYPLGLTKDAKYNYSHIDEDWFINQVDYYVFKKNYYQKWQTNDVISLQIISNAIAPATIAVYNSNKEIVNTYTFSQISNNIVKSPLILYEINLDMSLFSPGVYFFVITVGSGGTIDQFISEGINVKSKWDKTLLFEYTNKYNRLDMIFSSGFSPSHRIEGWIDNYKPKSHTVAYEDQPADMKILNSIPFGNFKLNIGTQYGIPPYEIRLLNIIMGLDNVLIDGLAFAKAEQDTEFEQIDVPNIPMKYWSLLVREAVNNTGITVTTEGSVDDELFVTYNVDMKGFGANTANNVVPIKKVE